MEQQLKHRLIGVIIIVALVIIFVPMLFEKSDDKGKLSSTGIPSIPDDILEKNIDLPKTAEEIAPPKEDEKKPAESGYKIVPFENEDTHTKPKSTGQPKSDTEEKGDKTVVPEENDTPKEAASDLGMEKEILPSEAAKASPTYVPDIKVPDVKKPKPQVHRLVKAKHHKTERKTEAATSPYNEPDADLDSVEGQPHNSDKADHPNFTTHHSQPSNHHKHGDTAVHKPITVKNTETANLPAHHHTKVKEVKPKPLPHLPETDRNLEDEPVPIPAKPVIPHAKTTTSAGTMQKAKVSVPKKPNKVKPSESGHPVKVAKPVTPNHPATKVNKTEPSPIASDLPQAKPKPAKPAPMPVKPAKPADSE